MPIGTASNRLRKLIIFSLIKEGGKNICFQCGEIIENERDLSIEHKIPYLDSSNPVQLFFDIENIAFSHLSCNIGAARKNKVGHSKAMYAKGCRCEICTSKNTEMVRKYRNNKRRICSLIE